MAHLSKRIAMSTMSVSDAVASRRSVRAFADKPVHLEILREILDKARFAPSGCNFQPWEATVLTGEPLRELRARMQAAEPQNPIEYDFSAPNASPPHLARLHALGAALYTSLGIERDDAQSRARFMAANIDSFAAPAVLLCYFPRLMKAPQWSDVGMWLQTIMLLVREAGLDSCPQEFLSLHARLIKDFLGVNDETHIFFCGLAIGYRDPDAPVNHFQRQRVPLDEQVRFLGF
jgi:nitroreductase